MPCANTGGFSRWKRSTADADSFNSALARALRVTRRQRARRYPARHLARASLFQCRGQFVETGSSRHHVVDQRDMLPSYVSGTGKCAAQITASCIVLQSRLRWCVADAPATAEIERESLPGRHVTGDFGGVVEAALTDACCMQRHGNQAIRHWCSFRGPSQPLAQRRCDGKLALVFQARNQSVERKDIAQRRNGTVERRGAFEAGAAGLSLGRGRGALWTLWLRVPGQIGQAGRAYMPSARRVAAQQTGSWDELIKN